MNIVHDHRTLKHDAADHQPSGDCRMPRFDVMREDSRGSAFTTGDQQIYTGALGIQRVGFDGSALQADVRGDRISAARYEPASQQEMHTLTVSPDRFALLSSVRI